jgi:hypothetical protein
VRATSPPTLAVPAAAISSAAPPPPPLPAHAETEADPSPCAPQNWNANFVAPTNSTAQSGMAGYALCSSSSKQSPINIAEQMAVYDATLLPLSLKYGDTESWTMEVTANYLEAAELETATTGSGLATLDTQTDGVVVDGVFVPLNQVRAAARPPDLCPISACLPDAAALTPSRAVPLPQPV